MAFLQNTRVTALSSSDYELDELSAKDRSATQDVFNTQTPGTVTSSLKPFLWFLRLRCIVLQPLKDDGSDAKFNGPFCGKLCHVVHRINRVFFTCCSFLLYTLMRCAGHYELIQPVSMAIASLVYSCILAVFEIVLTAKSDKFGKLLVNMDIGSRRVGLLPKMLRNVNYFGMAMMLIFAIKGVAYFRIAYGAKFVERIYGIEPNMTCCIISSTVACTDLYSVFAFCPLWIGIVAPINMVYCSYLLVICCYLSRLFCQFGRKVEELLPTALDVGPAEMDAQFSRQDDTVLRLIDDHRHLCNAVTAFDGVFKHVIGFVLFAQLMSIVFLVRVLNIFGDQTLVGINDETSAVLFLTFFLVVFVLCIAAVNSQVFLTLSSLVEHSCALTPRKDHPQRDYISFRMKNRLLAYTDEILVSQPSVTAFGWLYINKGFLLTAGGSILTYIFMVYGL